MLGRDDERRSLEVSVQALREAHHAAQQRAAEVDTLRHDFKRNRYDRAGSGFANSSNSYHRASQGDSAPCGLVGVPAVALGLSVQAPGRRGPLKSRPLPCSGAAMSRCASITMSPSCQSRWCMARQPPIDAPSACQMGCST